MTDSFSKTRLGRFREVMGAHVARGDVPGAISLVSRRGETFVDAVGRLEIDRAAPMQRDSIVRIASITKPIAAVATLTLIEECKLRLDDPIDAFLPELADRRVLKRIDGPLEDTVPAGRPISVRDLLTSRMGFGVMLEDTSSWPIQRALEENHIGSGPALPTAASSEAYIRGFASLPLMAQPGERWMYDTPFDVLGMLLERVEGKPLEAVLRGRVFEPLGMKDTAFSVAAADLPRFASCYEADRESRKLELWDAADGGKWSKPPGFASAAGGLVSTVDDCLAFALMLLNEGAHGKHRLLSRPAIELMRTDHITPEQKARSPFFPGFWDNTGWGFGVGITTRRDELSDIPGRFGWAGGYGTSLYVDPSNELVGVFFSQRLFDSQGASKAYLDFWTLAYQALAD